MAQKLDDDVMKHFNVERKWSERLITYILITQVRVGIFQFIASEMWKNTLIQRVI